MRIEIQNDLVTVNGVMYRRVIGSLGYVTRSNSHMEQMQKDAEHRRKLGYRPRHSSIGGYERVTTA